MGWFATGGPSNRRWISCCGCGLSGHRRRHFYGTNHPGLPARHRLYIFLAGAMGTSVAMLERYYADAAPKRKASAFSGITYKPPEVPGTGNDGIAARKKKSIDF